MVRVRFAPSPTGSLQVGNALTAVANRRFADEHGGRLLLRIDDTDAARNVPGGEAALVSDLAWLGVRFDDGPARQSDRVDRYREAARSLLARHDAFDDGGAVRFAGERAATLLRADGSPTYHLASVVDDADYGITHVIRGQDHLANRPLHEQLARALGFRPPDFVHHGLLLEPGGGKLAKRRAGGSLADLRAEGIPAEAVRRYLEELGLPRGNVVFDRTRLNRLSTDFLAELTDEELGARLGVAPAVAALARGTRTLAEARGVIDAVTTAPPAAFAANGSRPTLERFRDLRARADDPLSADEAQQLVRTLREGGADLRGLRLALTGAARGPELWRIVAALPREEALRRVDAAL
jgi:tRNA synthetases class I (E and Q), catalytic domain